MTELNTPLVTDIDRPILVPPGGHKKVLLHSCCAPCSGEVMEAMLASGIDYTIYFYNPNIHPHKEYMLRKEENMRFADKFGIPFVDKDDDYENDRKEWFAKAKGMEFEPDAVSAAPCVSTCVLKKQLNMPMKTAPCLHQFTGHFTLERP